MWSLTFPGLMGADETDEWVEEALPGKAVAHWVGEFHLVPLRGKCR